MRINDLKEVSVIIPCYNCEALVTETLDSLAKQTFQDFEVVCVNDGSKDNTLSVLEAWKSQNAVQMQIVDKPNGGVSSARNAGIQAAEGKYLLFLDADDLFHPEYIQRLWDAMTQNDADIAYCWLNRSKQILSTQYQDIPVVKKTQQEAMHDLLYRMAEIGFYCYLYRKEWILRENLEFDVNTRHFEDREFNWKYLCHCQSAVLVDAPLYFYRVTANSATQSKTVQWRTDGLDAAQRIGEYLEEKGCDYHTEIKGYLFPRVIWTMAKNYALGNAKDAFKRLGKEYDVKTCMRRTAKDSNKLIALASRFYLIHPNLFYYILRLKK